MCDSKQILPHKKIQENPINKYNPCATIRAHPSEPSRSLKDMHSTRKLETNIRIDMEFDHTGHWVKLD